MADKEFYCQICGKHGKETDLIHAESVSLQMVDLITKKHPAWSHEGYICHVDLNRFRRDYVRDILGKEKNEYVSLKNTDTPGINVEDHLPKNVNAEFEMELTFGERIADKMADFAGSWTFLGVFAGIIFLWIGLNTYILLSRPFDPYPYILLNLALSILAAVQAPVIIMSQNRQEIRDRLHAERDYQVSIHTDFEIHRLHKKIDYLLTSQGERFPEIQNVQVEMMEEMMEELSHKTP